MSWKSKSNVPRESTPERKIGSGILIKTSPTSDNLLKHEVLWKPTITAAEIKKKHLDSLMKVSVRIICQKLLNYLQVPGQRRAKTLLTEVMKVLKSWSHSGKYLNWTSEDRKNVIFSCKSAFRLITVSQITMMDYIFPKKCDYKNK